MSQKTELESDGSIEVVGFKNALSTTKVTSKDIPVDGKAPQKITNPLKPKSGESPPSSSLQIQSPSQMPG